MAMKYNNHNEKIPVAEMCALAEQMPAILKTAREYFPNCQSGSMGTLAQLEGYAVKLATIRDTNCQPARKPQRR